MGSLDQTNSLNSDLSWIVLAHTKMSEVARRLRLEAIIERMLRDLEEKVSLILFCAQNFRSNVQNLGTHIRDLQSCEWIESAVSNTINN